MKRIVAWILLAAVLACLLAGCKSNTDAGETSAETEVSVETASFTEAPTKAPTQAPAASYVGWRVALLSETVDPAERALTGSIQEACGSWCEARGVAFSSYEPEEQTTSGLKSMIKQAVADGSRILVLPGWTTVDAVKECVKLFPDVRFVLVDVSANYGRSYEYPTNLCNVTFQEQVLGFLAGYAAVKLGYRHLSFVGAKNTAPTVRYGYGFVQGANAAAVELEMEKEIAVDYVYADTTLDNPAVTAYVDAMYQKKGVELCFACGENVERSVCEAARMTEGAKVIGTDAMDRLEEAETINENGEESPVLTSVQKVYLRAVETVLTDVIERSLWSGYAGKTVSLGVVSGEDLAANYVELAASTKFEDGKFSFEDYAALIAALHAGDYAVSDETKTKPSVVIAVNYLGNIT